MADVKNRVASGELWFGITSTIDAHVAVDGGKPVVVIFPDQATGDIGCLNGYNTVALVAGGSASQGSGKAPPLPDDHEDGKNPRRRSRAECGDAAGERRPERASRVDSTGPPQRWTWTGTQAVKAHPAATKAVKEILLDQ